MLAVFDTDGVLINSRREEMSGTVHLIGAFLAAGYRVVIWSGAPGHAKETVDLLDLSLETADKPSFPMTVESVIETLGERPEIQFDDDPAELVGEWAHILIAGGEIETPRSKE